MVARTNITAVNRTIAAMTAAGHLDALDAAQVALARTTARALDAAEPGSAASASCARAHCLALERLHRLTEHNDDSITRLLDELALPTPMGDTTHP